MTKSLNPGHSRKKKPGQASVSQAYNKILTLYFI